MILAGILFALLLGLLLWLQLPRARFPWLTLAAYLTLAAVAYAGAIEAASRPKPVWLEWREVRDAPVLGATIEEGLAIHVWLALPDGPRAFTLPWDVGTASQLSRARAKAAEAGTGVLMRNIKPGLDDREPMFYERSQPAMPEKDYSAGPAEIFGGSPP